MTARVSRGHGSRLRPAVVLVLAAAAVTTLGLDRGGYYPTAWGSAALVALGVAAAAIGLGGVPLGPREWIALASLGAWLSVVAAGALRHGAATAGAPVVERGALYVVSLWAALLVLRRSTVVWALAGLLVGLVALTAVGLFDVLLPTATTPDAFEGRLLFQPVGYANGMGVLIAIAFLLSVAFAAHSAGAVRTIGAALLVPLAAARVLTGSRGALAALVAGLVVLVVADDAVGTLAFALPLPIAAAILAAQSHVADAHASAHVAVRDGHVLAVLIVALAVANGFVRVRVPRVSRRVGLSIAGLVTVAACAAAPFALEDRLPFWRAALRDVAAHPLLGSGPGSFGAAWLQFRDVPQSTLDAHNLYLQTLAEVGPLGTIALMAALAVPLTALRQARHPYAPAAAAAYVASVVHAGFDWDWEIPVVPIVAFVLAGVLLACARSERKRSGRAVSAAAAATGLAAVAACAVAVGNSALVGASDAANAGDWPRAQQLAARAQAWQPWSAEPLLERGKAEVAAGDLRGARASFARAAALAPGDWRPWYDLGAASRGQERRTALAHVAALVHVR